VAAARLAALAPKDARALALRGVLALRDGSPPERAEALLARAVDGDPKDVAAQANLAVVRRRLGDLSGAEGAYGAALALAPENAKLRFNYANLLKDLKRSDAAEGAYQAALSLDPALGVAWSNLGALYRDTDRPALAVHAFRRALALAEDRAGARVSLAESLDRAGRLPDAIACLTDALRAEPDHAVAHWNRALMMLRQGDLRRGLPEFEWRWRLPQHRPRALGQPGWAGQPMPGASVLIHAEQGLGDTLMYGRWLPAVARRVGHVVLECQASLVRLMRASFPGVTVVARGEPLPPVSAHAPLMSLPLLLGVTDPSAPLATTPYLRAAPLAPDGPLSGPRVGLVWNGGPGTTATAPLRSIPFDDLTLLWTVPGVSWVSLQVGEAAADLSRAPVPIADMAPRLHDFADTAAVAAGLDLIITIDTSVAHLAGGLGRPTWILLKADADWRWFLDRADSPWYPSATLFRQPRPRAWGPVVEDVARRLHLWTRA